MNNRDPVWLQIGPFTFTAFALSGCVLAACRPRLFAGRPSAAFPSQGKLVAGSELRVSTKKKAETKVTIAYYLLAHSGHTNKEMAAHHVNERVHFRRNDASGAAGAWSSLDRVLALCFRRLNNIRVIKQVASVNQLLAAGGFLLTRQYTGVEGMFRAVLCVHFFLHPSQQKHSAWWWRKQQNSMNKRHEKKSLA